MPDPYGTAPHGHERPVECQAVSLTRGIPTGLGWLIEPIIRGLPRDSLANTLRATRAAVARP